ncbi:MAG: TraR/DksA C4-type zinc finger protein [Patescibacteria group bacterium]|nr:TraR/DksA C4-type zinc finger protein [Patescibacteria group bacterium]
MKWKHRKISRSEAESLLREREKELLQGLSRSTKNQLLRLQGRENSSPRELGVHRILSQLNYEAWISLQEAKRTIQNGDWGICECGKQIPEARLRIFPETEICTKCKSLHEKTALFKLPLFRMVAYSGIGAR